MPAGEDARPDIRVRAAGQHRLAEILLAGVVVLKRRLRTVVDTGEIAYRVRMRVRVRAGAEAGAWAGAGAGVGIRVRVRVKARVKVRFRVRVRG